MIRRPPLLLGVLAIVLAAGCTQSAPVPPPPPPPPQMMEIPAPTRFRLRVGAVRGFMLGMPGGRVATRTFAPPQWDGFYRAEAVAMVVFPHAPTSRAERQRHQRICEGFLGVLPDSAEMRRVAPRLRQMITIWPRNDLKSIRSVSARTPRQAAAECRAAVSNYTYPLAAAWIAAVPDRARLNRSRRGPFLIAWAPPDLIGRPRAAVLIFDLSDFDRPGGINRAFRIWREEIEGDPALWDQGWNVERFKAVTAARLDRYGGQITAAMTLVPWLKG